jgi:DNA (cytosine-5)-methyltransferase 1
VRRTIGSLFSGIGGLEYGLELAGVGRTVWQVERDAFCRGVLARHWPEARRHDDVRTATAALLGPADVVCGGFPCQDISQAGRGAGLDGERSGLWFEFARLLSEMRPRPRAVVVENVAALLSRGFDVVLSDLADLGYARREWAVLRASDVGAPHQRARLFVLAYADGDRQRQPSGGQSEEWGWVGHRGAVANPDGGKLRQQSRRGGGANGPGAPLAREHGETGVGDAECPRRSGALDTSGAPQRRVPAKPGRRVGEAQPRVGGHPDGVPAWLARWPAGRGETQHEWEPPRTVEGQPIAGRRERLRALGNAVVPQVAAIVGRRVVDLLQGVP